MEKRNGMNAIGATMAELDDFLGHDFPIGFGMPGLTPEIYSGGNSVKTVNVPLCTMSEGSVYPNIQIFPGSYVEGELKTGVRMSLQAAEMQFSLKVPMDSTVMCAHEDIDFIPLLRLNTPMSIVELIRMPVEPEISREEHFVRFDITDDIYIIYNADFTETEVTLTGLTCGYNNEDSEYDEDDYDEDSECDEDDYDEEYEEEHEEE